MTELFSGTKNVLEDVAAIESDGNLEIKPELLNELDQLSQTVQSELQCKNPTVNQPGSL